MKCSVPCRDVKVLMSETERLFSGEPQRFASFDALRAYYFAELHQQSAIQHYETQLLELVQ